MCFKSKVSEDVVTHPTFTSWGFKPVHSTSSILTDETCETAVKSSKVYSKVKIYQTDHNHGVIRSGLDLNIGQQREQICEHMT